MASEAPPKGVLPLDHTADVAIEVEASTIAELFARAARGMAWLLDGGRPAASDDGGADAEPRAVELIADDAPELMRAWLRELLFWHETEGLAFGSARFGELTGTALDAEVELRPAALEPIREIKGVTFHGLVTEPRGGGWFARVIFDV